MTSTIVNVPVRVRMTKAERKVYLRDKRRQQLRLFLYNLICWFQDVCNRLPVVIVRTSRKVCRAIVQCYAAFIFIILSAAVFFAATGLLTLALEFWASVYPA